MPETSDGTHGWREAAQAEDERRRRRRPRDEREALRRVTVSMVVAAVGLNAVLFVQTGVSQVGVGGLQDAVVAAMSSLFPAGGLRPASETPTPSPRGSGVVTTGSS